MSRDAVTFKAAWGGVLFDIDGVSVRQGRRQVRHTQPRRDGAELEPMGRESWEAEIRFFFFDHRRVLPGEGSMLERFRRFDEMVGEERARTLVHPYQGSIVCRVENFEHSSQADGEDVIECTATFIEDLSQPNVQDLAERAPAVAGAQQVTLDVAEAQSALADAGVESTVLADVEAAVESWDTDLELSPRTVALEMASLNNRLSAELDSFEAASDLDNFAIVKQYTRLQANLRRASEIYTRQTSRLVTITVHEPIPLRVVAARYYGAREADKRFAELLELNDIDNPALVERDTVLRAFAKQPRSRRRQAG